MGIKHAFTSAKSDGGDTTLVRPSNWNADHATTEMDTTKRLAPDGAGGVEWVAASAAVAYPLDTPPGSPHASDDEFDDTTGMSGPTNGLDAQWTAPVTSAADQGVTVSYPVAGWMQFEPTTSGTASTGKRTFGMRQASPSGSFTVMAKIIDNGNLDDGRAGIFVATTGGKARVLGSQRKNNRLYNLNGVTTYSESADWSGYDGLDSYAAPTWPLSLWYRLVYDASASTLTAYYSVSGLAWTLIATVSSVTQPDRMGLVIWGNTADIRADHSMAVDWFRVTEP